jgi:hypothetical protein
LGEQVDTFYSYLKSALNSLFFCLDKGVHFILQVTPSEGLVSSGSQGGPFSPSSKAYTLTNTGGTSINWTASKGQSWVSLSATSGTLSPGGSTTVTVSINSNANSLTPSSYSDTVSFTNTTNGNGNTNRSVSLTIQTYLLPAPALISPQDGGTNQSTTPTFTWLAVTGATSYRIMVATNPASLPTDPTVGTCSGCVINTTSTYTYYA